MAERLDPACTTKAGRKFSRYGLAHQISSQASILSKLRQLHLVLVPSHEDDGAKRRHFARPWPIALVTAETDG